MKTCLKCNEVQSNCTCENPIYSKNEYISDLEASLAEDGEALTLIHQENDNLYNYNESLIKFNEKLKEEVDRIESANEAWYTDYTHLKKVNTFLEERLNKAVNIGLKAQEEVRELTGELECRKTAMDSMTAFIDINEKEELFMGMFPEGFKIDIIPHPYIAEKGIAMMLVHPDNMPGQKEVDQQRGKDYSIADSLQALKDAANNSEERESFPEWLKEK